jgi:hypothetical protein
MRTLFSAATGLVLLAAVSLPALAHFPCQAEESLKSQIRDRYGEGLAALARTDAGLTIELWQSAETGTWTLLLIPGDGRACLIEAGRGWRLAPDGPAHDPGGAAPEVPA